MNCTATLPDRKSVIDEIDEIDALAPAEQDELARCEQIISRGLQMFVQVGQALQRIRDERLYRATHPTFESYLADRWNISRTAAHQYIAAAAVVENVRNCEQIEPPQNEAQCRPLAQLEPDEQTEAWTEAVESAPAGKVTGAHVNDVVQKRLKRREKERAQAASKLCSNCGHDQVDEDGDCAKCKEPGVAPPESSKVKKLSPSQQKKKDEAAEKREAQRKKDVEQAIQFTVSRLHDAMVDVAGLLRDKPASEMRAKFREGDDVRNRTLAALEKEIGHDPDFLPKLVAKIDSLRHVWDDVA
jgi:hypothetical protein